jgi:signal recognition particle subunit SRP54
MNSMTKKERRDPKIFEKEPTRKTRVIKGSGRKPDEFNKMMSDFKKALDKIKIIGQNLRSGKNPLKGMM